MSFRFTRMPHAEMDIGVVFFYEILQTLAIKVTDEGIIPMTTHRRILHEVIPAQTVHAGGSTGAVRTDPLVRTARGITILALVLGGLGAGAAASSGHSSADQPAGNTHLAAGSMSSRPWMY